MEGVLKNWRKVLCRGLWDVKVKRDKGSVRQFEWDLDLKRAKMWSQGRN